ncbi:hypothetical protein AGMMS50262_21890 [Bacteroidia bacterium]|nr:hypothetical protein AGMMS50262_21890 [Bacteroidia bacterium]
MKNKKIHIGNLIQDKLKADGRSVTWLAKRIHCERNNIYGIFKRPSIDSELLLYISLTLETNFFTYYSAIYNDLQMKD